MSAVIVFRILAALVLVLQLGVVEAVALRGSAEVFVLESGDVRAVYSVKIESHPAEVSLVIVRRALQVGVYCGREPIPFSYDPMTGQLSFLATCTDISIEAFSQELTRKEGMLWILQLNPQSLPVTVILPATAILVSAEPPNYTIVGTGQGVGLLFSPNVAIKIEYILAPAEPRREIPLYLIAAALLLAALLALAGYAVYRRKFRSSREKRV